MLDTELSSITEDEFPIWVRICSVDLHDKSTTCWDMLPGTIRCFIEKRYLNCRQVTIPIRQSLVDRILERFRVPPSTHEESVASVLSRLGSSLSMRVTTRSILFNVSKLATLEACRFKEEDETAWTGLYQPNVGSFVLPCIPKATAKDFTHCLGPDNWGRPLWAWTWCDRLFGHATLLALDLMEQIPFQTTVIISDSADDFTNIPLSCDGIHRHNIYVLYREAKSSQPCEGKDSILDQDRTNENADDSDRQYELQLNPTLLVERSLDVDDDNNTLSQQDTPVAHECHAATTLSGESLQNDATNSPEFSATCLEETPDGSMPLCTDNVPIVTPSPKDSPQYDSQGIDISLLSQLPKEVRAEARLALAIQGKGRRHYKMKAGLMKWFTAPTSHEPRRSKKESITSAGKTKPKKRHLIDDFLVKKEHHGPRHIN